jgi:hypothetical protein
MALAAFLVERVGVERVGKGQRLADTCSTVADARFPVLIPRG